MCLIIVGPSNQIAHTLRNTPGLMEDILEYNGDGIGFMYANSKGIKVVKKLPTSTGAAFKMINSLPNDERQVAIHFRRRTHGNINTDMVHPYTVVEDALYMMHNGVLGDGNRWDKAKSDTWHFIERKIKPAVLEHPLIWTNKGFILTVEEAIEDNRFVFMDSLGVIEIYNKDQGIEHDGMWFSNTYAWVPSRLIPGFIDAYAMSDDTGFGVGWAGWSLGDYHDPHSGHDITQLEVDESTLTTEEAIQVFQALESGDFTQTYNAVTACPSMVVECLLWEEATVEIKAGFGEKYAYILDAIEDENYTTLQAIASKDPAMFSRAVSSYVQWKLPFPLAHETPEVEAHVGIEQDSEVL